MIPEKIYTFYLELKIKLGMIERIKSRNLYIFQKNGLRADDISQQHWNIIIGKESIDKYGKTA